MIRTTLLLSAVSIVVTGLFVSGCAGDTGRVQDFPVKCISSKGYVDAGPRRVSIVGVIGEGPHYSEAQSYPGRILQIRLKKRKQHPDLANHYGARVIPGSNDRECEVWVGFSGAIGKKAVGVFDVYVRYEEP